jgi:hypothetical protein
LNQHALNRGAAALQSRPSHSPYSNNPNAYFNRVRDNGFVSHYDVRRHRPPAYQPTPTASPGNTGGVAAQPAAATAARKPAPPLGSFFDASQKLAWPSDSPIDGDLKEKRNLSDQASLAVLEEVRQQTTASVSSATHAREKLLDYGRPALQEMRTRATPAIAETFHHFLLSLYDSLAQAAWPVDANPGTAPNP